MLYVPVCKFKQGEKDALFKLKEETKSAITPLFELTPDRIDKEDFKYFNDKWINEFYFDFSNDATFNADEEIIPTLMAIEKYNSIPCFHLGYENSILQHFNNSSFDKIALRIDVEEALDDDFGINLSEFISEIECDSIDLIIDAKFIDSDNYKKTAFSMRTILDDFIDLTLFDRCILLSTSFPDTLSNNEKNNISFVKRTEQNLYKTVQEKVERELIYGDYCVNTWKTLEYIPGMQTSFNIRYTIDNNYLIIKGETTKKGGFDYNRVSTLCNMLVTSSYFSGPELSDGDKQIHLRTAEDGKPGNATTWRAIGTNHHIEYITNSISNRP